MNLSDFKGALLIMYKIRRVLKIFMNMILIIVLIASISIKVLVRSKGIGANYLRKTIAWAHFVQNTESMNKQTFNYNTIYSKNKLDNSNYKLIEEYIQKGNNDIINIFGQTPSRPINIVIFPTIEEYQKVLNDRDSAASYDGYSMYLQLDELTSYTLVHEYINFKTEYFCQDNKISTLLVPMWFNEGISEYISYQYRKNIIIKPLERLKNFSELNNHKEFTNARLAGYDVYYQSYLAIKKIIELKGNNSIKNIILDSKNRDFYSAFEKNVGLNIEDFQKLLK